MKSRYVVPLVLYLLLGGAGGVSAGELGHYAPGLLNIRDFFVPEPGFYYAQYHYFYGTDTLKNRNGDEVESLTRTGPLGTTTASVDVDVFVLAPAFLWVSPWKVLGARYGAIILNYINWARAEQHIGGGEISLSAKWRRMWPLSQLL